MKINEAIASFKDYVTATKTLGTQNYYQFYFKRIQKYFENIEVESIGKREITSFIAFIKQESPKIKNISINKYIVALKTIVKYSTDRIIDFKKLSEQKAVIPIISDATIKIVFDHLKSNFDDKNNFRNYVLFNLLLDTGLRINELLHIKVRNIDWSTNSIYAEVTKTNNNRYVGFTEATKGLLNRYIMLFEPINELFFDLNTKVPLKTSSVESIVHRLKIKLKLTESISPHKWRHTFATNFLRKGGDLETLRMLMGHSSLKTTQKYLHLTKQNIIDEYAKVMRNTDYLPQK